MSRNPGVITAALNPLARPDLDHLAARETVATTVRHLGSGTILAISGGRVRAVDDVVVLPVAAGRVVEVAYDRARDLYDVRRVRARGLSRTVETETVGVYADQLADVAYRASLWEDA